MHDSMLAVKLDHTDEELTKYHTALLVVLASDSGNKVQTDAFSIGPDKAIHLDLQL